MKLRIRNNSVRLRLNRRDVERLSLEGLVSDVLRYGVHPEHVLDYGAEVGSFDAISLRPEANGFVVQIPVVVGRSWIDTDSISLEATHEIDGVGTVDILVEKDLACLTPREEDDGLAFPNPAHNC